MKFASDLQQVMESRLLEQAGLIIGAVICVGVLLQLLLLSAGSLRRMTHESRARQLELSLLRTQIEAARKRRALTDEQEKAWEGWRKFEVFRKEVEANETTSVYLRPHDKRPLPGFAPGQYLTFQLNLPGADKSVVRCYSLSDCARDEYYRVTVKKVPPPRDKPELPPGRSSSYFNDMLAEGDILDVKAPHGAFYLDMTRQKPVVLIGGGIGITPVLSMLNAIVASGSKRETWFFLGVRHGKDHPFKQHLQQIAAEHENVHLHICYSDPTGDDVEGRDFHHGRRVGVDLFQQLLPSNNYDYYLCGPGPFMEAVVKGLDEWGVPEQRVHFEAFGPASVKKAKAKPEGESPGAPAQTVAITFTRSGKTLQWDGTHENLLELAESNGVMIDSGCRAGNCGTCLTAVKNGKVKYPKDTGIEVESGSCLTCIGVPDGPVELDA